MANDLQRDIDRAIEAFRYRPTIDAELIAREVHRKRPNLDFATVKQAAAQELRRRFDPHGYA